MSDVPRVITSSRDGKTLFLRINKIKLTAPWQSSRYYRGETVLVSLEAEKEKTIYSVRPQDIRLPWNETHWQELPEANIDLSTLETDSAEKEQMHEGN